MLKIYNSLSQCKQEFKPIQAGEVSLYVCGMTVYDYCHIGHARPLFIFDMVVKYFRFCGYQVKFVRNITDIDDKIIQQANENKEPWDQLTARFITAMHEDADGLGIAPPDFEPLATAHMEPIITLIQSIIDKGCAYATDKGDVFFAIDQFAEYGKLSHRDVDKMLAGTRGDVELGKKNPLDFALWKSAKPNEPQWDSPWGAGRPGWHIECSAMATHILGQPFDIHGGGMDLKFPHHENEIAQSEAACPGHFAHYWMHVGLLQINSEKMSKSLGNFITIREALETYHPEVLRYFMLSGHYRSPINFSAENLQQMRNALASLYTAINDLPVVTTENEDLCAHYETLYRQVMDDDFNTPKLFSVFFDMARHINRLRDESLQQAAQLANTLKRLAGVIGLLHDDPVKFLQRGFDSERVAVINELITQRNQAREQKDWAKSDQVRNELLAMGIELEDGPDGTVWRAKD